jgi:hypothetical protein
MNVGKASAPYLLKMSKLQGKASPPYADEVAAQVKYDVRGCFLHLEGKATVKLEAFEGGRCEYRN